MESNAILAATLLSKNLIKLEPGVKDNFCHIHLEEQESKCYQGKVFNISRSWLICDECMEKIKNIPNDKLFLDDYLLKQKLKESENVEIDD